MYSIYINCNLYDTLTLIKDDRRIKVLQVAKIMQILYGSVETIIHDHLKMTKVSANGYHETWLLKIGVAESHHLKYC